MYIFSQFQTDLKFEPTQISRRNKRDPPRIVDIYSKILTTKELEKCKPSIEMGEMEANGPVTFALLTSFFFAPLFFFLIALGSRKGGRLMPCRTFIYFQKFFFILNRIFL